MTSNLKIGKYAVQVALKELRHGKKQAARSWAQHAVEMAPGLEEAWLVLAAVAEPRASLEYIKKALEINPDSQRARQGLSDVQQRLEKISQVEPAQTPHPSAPVLKKRNTRFLLGWFRLFPVYALAIFALVILTRLAFQSRLVSAYAYPADKQELIVLQPISSSTSIKTMTVQAQSTETTTATALPTDTPSFTPLPTETSTPTALPTETSTPTALPTETVPPTALPTETFPPTQSPAPTLKAAPVIISPTQSVNASAEKRIVVRISEQHLYAYQGDTLVQSYVISTGAENSTQIGSFPILDKIPEAWSDPWGFWMPDWLGIYWAGSTENGIHALPVLSNGNVIWEDALGTPISHGCVVLNPADAQSLYDWADIGTQVDILP